MIHLFISYRRSDSLHAAQRVRAFMQAKFGADAVFIDRDIPPGADWAQFLRQQLASASDVIVLVGDAFLRELRDREAAKGAETDEDWLKAEIRIALELKKPIYPVLIGRLDMPGRRDLPKEIEGFAAAQAVFAREPAFDAAMAVLARTIAGRHGWVAPVPRGEAAGAAGAGLGTAGSGALVALAALLGTWVTGRLIHWLATGSGGAPSESTLWLGVLYGLLTMLLGLGPYLIYRAVAEVRARAHLPVLNPLAAITMLSSTVVTLAGGTFLLLSTRAEWALKLRWLVPDAPGPFHFALQGLVLLAIVTAALAVPMLEPAVRRREDLRRKVGMAVLYGAAATVALAALWFGESLVASMPPLRVASPVPVIGYFMLAPALSVLIVSWEFARGSLGLSGQSLYGRTLFGLAVALYLACTLGYFAHGPVRLFVELG